MEDDTDLTLNTQELATNALEKPFTPEEIEHWKQIAPDEFIDSVRHEMMNFLMPILGFTELIQEQGDLDLVVMQFGESKLTLREFCDVVLRQQEKVYHMRDLLALYSKSLRENTP